MKRLKLFLFNGILLTITSFIMRSIGVFFNVYISNKIGTEAVGLFQLIMSVYMFAITLATSGINLAATKIVSEELALQNNNIPKRAMKKCISYSLFLGITAFILLILFAPYLSQYLLHNKIPYYLFYILGISLPFISMSAALNGYFIALRLASKNAFARLVEQFIKITVTSYCLSMLFPTGIEYACLSLILGETVSELLSCFINFLLYFSDLRKRKICVNEPSNSKYTKRILGISVPIAITSYIRSGLASLKQLLIPLSLEKSGLSCEKSISEYGIISGMAMPILLFPEVIINSFSSLLVPEFSAYYAKRQSKQINYAIGKIFHITFLFSILTVGIFACYSNVLSLIIYQNIEIAYYFKILCPLILFMYLDSIVDNILKGLDKQVGVMACNIIDLLVSILCIYFVVPLYGIPGYLFVIFLSEILNLGISTFQLWRFTHFYIDFKNWIIRPFLCVLLAYFVMKIFSINFENLLIEISVSISSFIIIYLLGLFITSKSNMFKNI